MMKIVLVLTLANTLILLYSIPLLYLQSDDYDNYSKTPSTPTPSSHPTKPPLSSTDCSNLTNLLVQLQMQMKQNNNDNNNNQHININNEDENNSSNNERLPTLVAYVFSKRDGTDLHLKNLEFFLKYGVCENCNNIDFVILINGPTDFNNFPKYANVRVIHRNASTCGSGDFEAWDYLLSSMTPEERQKYKRIMFINDTVRGPFVHPIIRSQNKNFHFTDLFANRITKDTKLVGSFINCGRWGDIGHGAHVQTMVWMTDDVGLELIKDKIQCYLSKEAAVVNGEMGISKTMLDNGYNLASLQLAYFGVDFVGDMSMRSECNGRGDSTIEGNYFGESINPLETLFIKNTRDGWHIVDVYTSFFEQIKDKQ